MDTNDKSIDPTGQFPAADWCSKCKRDYKNGDTSAVISYHSHCADCAETAIKQGAKPTSVCIFVAHGKKLNKFESQKAFAQINRLAKIGGVPIQTKPMAVA